MNKTYSNSKQERHLTSLRQIAETSAGSRLLLLILKRKSSCFLGNIWVTYNSMNHYLKKKENFLKNTTVPECLKLLLFKTKKTKQWTDSERERQEEPVNNSVFGLRHFTFCEDRSEASAALCLRCCRSDSAVKDYQCVCVSSPLALAEH